MKIPSLSLVASAMACIAPAAFAEPSSAYLAPHLEVGESLSSVFSKAVAITGPGFQDVVKRISGTSDEVVRAIHGNEIIFNGSGVYDGRPAQKWIHRRLKDGITDCWNGQCNVNDQTSGTIFNRYLWGNAPRDIHVGASWAVVIAKPWEIGPQGSEQVRVLRLDPLNHVITLTREGSGAGPSSDDAYKNTITITTSIGKTLDVRVVPGESHWTGYTTVRKGVIIADEILVERHVTLIAGTGQRFEGEQRTYTLENLASDSRDTRG
ncbi:MAG TPA: hypothetical protein VFW10_16660 [Steroidobacteraceae bacterium]|nr:hypothetical protein [Steroidobacteraceae bacterium]